MKIRNIPDKIKIDAENIDEKFIFQAIERYIDKGVSKKSVLHKFEMMKERNIQKYNKLLESLHNFQNKIQEMQNEINTLNDQIDNNIARIRQLLS